MLKRLFNLIKYPFGIILISYIAGILAHSYCKSILSPVAFNFPNILLGVILIIYLLVGAIIAMGTLLIAYLVLKHIIYDIIILEIFLQLKKYYRYVVYNEKL